MGRACGPLEEDLLFYPWCDTPLSDVLPADANATQSSQVEGILCCLQNSLLMLRMPHMGMHELSQERAWLVSRV